MRPHRLELTAFGAFPDGVELDFDRLRAGGLVLLCGETGGGKTTLLDALGFALYGTVPGLRSRARDLRSHHADTRTEPWVRLEFSLSGRRYRIARTASWERPKRGGGGSVRVNPTALLERWAEPGWEVVAQRNDDVGLEISRLLGMTAEQFFQVIMLPQGHFADFLQADHDARERLLKRLFGVDRFEHAEQWLVEHAKIADERVTSARGELARVVARAAQAAESAEPADPESDPEWVARLAADAAAAATTAGDRAAVAAQTRRRAEDALEQTRHLAERQSERRDLVARLETLEAELTVVTTTAAELDAAQRANPVRRAVDHVEERVDNLEQARRVQEAGRNRLRLLGARHDASVDELARLARLAHTDVGRLEQLSHVLAGAEADDAGAQAADADAGTHAAAVARLTEYLRTDLPQQRQVLDARLDRARAGAAALPGVREQARVATELAITVLQRHDATARAHEAERAARDAHTRAGDIRRQRFDAITAELAAALVDDSPCPVCGSFVHPDPAEVRADHINKDDELAAEAEAGRLAATATGARRDADRLDGRIRTLRSELTNRGEPARATADMISAHTDGESSRAVESFATVTVVGIIDSASHGDGGSTGDASDVAGGHDSHRSAADAGSWRPALPAAPEIPAERPAEEFERTAAELAAHAEALAAAADDVPLAERALALFREEETRATAELAGHSSARQLAATHAEEFRTRAARARSGIPPELRDADQLAARQREVAQFADAYAECHTAAAATALAQEEHRRAVATADGDARAAGFPDAATARAACRDERWLAEARTQLEAHRDDLVAVRSRLASPQLAVDLHAPAPVADHVAATLGARDAHEEALADAARAGDRARCLFDLVAVFAAAFAAVAPLRDAAEHVRGLADVAVGRGENRQGMPLSSFVLAARLEEVATAASGRLSAMSGGRFTLVHDAGERRDRRRRAGLGLLVEDAWTGRRRDTATLSGGETFQAALSLALGLADVVTAESGGQAMDALFIDEGFGSLDPDSLEEVMNVLDDLRSGGRLVGVVSHVADLRQRIPTQITVVKGTRGSQVRTTLR
ncbi:MULTISPECIES: AAA family ATPase [unclassified Frankia]|uniref:AAA family ATPase n=1 Tax=unclassified Frankia TaxID=2632575 RepID=UPI002AD3C86B|nr:MULTISPECIES: AAA family ATPase [unclassified Frankia]